MTPAKLWLVILALDGALAVALGAFGAHGLRDKLTPSALAIWQTGVQYQFYHLLALGLVALLLHQGWQSPLLAVSAALFVIGTVLFCGSLYGLALGGPRWLGPVTPLGGLAFIAGWVVLAVAALRS